MASGDEFWGRRTFCLVTGASRGIGKAISVEFSKKVGEGSVVVLMARSEGGLQETKAEVEAAAPHVGVHLIPIDLSHTTSQTIASGLEQVLTVASAKPDHFDHAIIVHNVAMMGTEVMKPILQVDVASYQELYQLNLFSVVTLNKAFFQLFTGGKRSVINISSGCAIDPKITWGLYCTSRAAREMYFRTLALEEPSVAVLCYAPGVVATEQFEGALRHTIDETVKGELRQIKAEGKLLSPTATAIKLVELLRLGSFKSGDHVEYDDC